MAERRGGGACLLPVPDAHPHWERAGDKLPPHPQPIPLPYISAPVHLSDLCVTMSQQGEQTYCLSQMEVGPQAG